ncbi:ribosomal-protein-alanine N-acetyltransferase [Nocardioides aurantiacus]|uniref:[Ribosomal protein bS18]-alanine N-acetyltransferase n=1 Tax=Nocardioides aurantiacus TaxID=86796 RepID=A0A3N2CQD9_9ACTN|nr:ribosomal-protein-alanine N-acetyltransferase [Nocardioides aurantiacus]
MTVRPGRDADLAAVVDLERVCLGEDAWGEALVAPGLAGGLPTVSYAVAVTADVVVGHAVLSAVGDVAELQRIGVAPDRRRHGVAALLLADVVEQAEGAGAERLLLEVREDNAPALALYARHGFEELARRRRYYADGATAVVLQRGLGLSRPG